MKKAFKRLDLDEREIATVLTALVFWGEQTDEIEERDDLALERIGMEPVKLLDSDEVEELILRLKTAIH